MSPIDTKNRTAVFFKRALLPANWFLLLRSYPPLITGFPGDSNVSYVISD